MPVRHHVLTEAQQAAEYYRFAYTCEKMKERGCPGLCMNCQFNVSLYVEDPREAVLIKSSAQIDYAKESNDQHAEHNKHLMVAVIIIAASLFLFFQCNKPKPYVAPPTQVVSPTSKYDKPRTHYVWDAVNFVHNNVIDVNDDGMINCIDYAIVFRLVMGSSVRIIHNENYATGMNHLFNLVPGNNGYGVYVEPQGSPDNYLMSQVWGSEYDPYYNIDETEYWLSQIVYYPW